jgi:hypothetical protein
LTDFDIAAALAPAGLEFIGRGLGEDLLPLKPNKSAAGSPSGDGRFDGEPDEFVDVDDPSTPARVNASRLRMATEYGLLDGRREFLLNVNYSTVVHEPERAWVRVRLAD